MGAFSESLPKCMAFYIHFPGVGVDLEMAGMPRNGWKCQEVAGDGWKLLKMTENDWKWLDIAGNSWNGRKWLEMTGNIWKWL